MYKANRRDGLSEGRGIIFSVLVMLHLFFRRDIPATYDLAKLKAPRDAIRDVRTFKTGWIVLILLLVGFFALEPLGTGFLTAALSSVMNNMPTVLVGALSIDGSAAQGVVKEAMIYANIIGCDLGPKITPIGSLATLLWLHVLAQKNITISWGDYFRVGIVMTLPVLFVTLAALALRLSV